MKDLTKEQIMSIVFKSFSTSGLAYGEEDISSRQFILKYWLDYIRSANGFVERYKLLEHNNFIRTTIEALLINYYVDNRYCRFIEDSKFHDNACQHVYVGLSKKRKP